MDFSFNTNTENKLWRAADAPSMRGGQIGFKLRPVFFTEPLKRSLIRPEHFSAAAAVVVSSSSWVSEFISHTSSARQQVATFTASYKNVNKRVKKKENKDQQWFCLWTKRTSGSDTHECNQCLFHNRCEAYDRTWEHLGVFYRPMKRLFQHTNCKVTALWGYNVEIVWTGSLSSRLVISSCWEHNITTSTDILFFCLLQST